MKEKGVLTCVTDTTGKIIAESSAVLLDTGIVLLHGSIFIQLLATEWLRSIIDKINEQLSSVCELEKHVGFVVFHEEDFLVTGHTRAGTKMITAGAWICPLVKESLQKLTENPSEDYHVKSMSLFLLLRNPTTSISNLDFNLSRLAEPVRGQDVIVESTPFCVGMTINSISRGVVSRSFGKHHCCLLTDAATAPGSNGGPIFSVNENNEKGLLIGIVIIPQIKCDNDDRTTGLSLGISLLPVLQRLVQNKYQSIQDQLTVTKLVDETVVLISCGFERGSGVVIDSSSGIILTCSHVLAQNQGNVTVYHKGRPFPCDILYRTSNEKAYDLALVKVSSPNAFKFQLELESAPPKIGEIVYATGFPLLRKKIKHSDEKPTITKGCVSKINSFQFQTTCNILPGHSGGAIIKNNKLLGIIVCVFEHDTIQQTRFNHAIPTSVFRYHVLKYIRTKNIKYLKQLESSSEIVQNVWVHSKGMSQL